MRGLASCLCVLGFSGLALSSSVFAAEDTPAEEAEAASAEEGAGEAEPEAEASSEVADEAKPTGTASSDGKAKELWIGARYRGIIIPEFVWGLFADGGDGMFVNGVGPEFAIRSGNREINLSAWLAFYKMDPVGFKGKNDEEEAWEILALDLKVLYLTSDFMWSTPLASKLELSYGVGVGLGFVFGDMLRNQAFLVPGGTQGEKEDYAPCVAPGVPNGQYCDNVNEHYLYEEKSWFGGGPKPSLLPWVNGQIGLRYRLHEKFLARVEAGVGTGVFFFGIGADYAL
jgi:hypothetical protein